MRLVTEVWERVRALVRGRRDDQETEEELRFHLEMETRKYFEAGMDEPDARRLARLRLGGMQQVKEDVREARGIGALETLGSDLRYATRRLARDWRFTLLAGLILALGIGANTAMFSVVNGVFSRSLPFRDSDRLVHLYQNDRDSGQPALTSYPAFEDMAAYTDLYVGLMAVSLPAPVRFSQDGTVRSGLAEYATSGYLEVLGLEASRGRWFTGAEDRPGAAAVAVLSHHAWATKFGAAAAIIGETLRINGVAVTVIGVGPEGLTSGFHSGIATDFWLSIPSILTVSGRTLARDPSGPSFMVTARLRDGVSPLQAQAGMTALGERLAREFPGDDPGRGISVVQSDAVLVHPQIDGVLTYGASFLMIVAGLLLAIACTNLATWLLVRGSARARELSVRLALGATRWQLVRHLLVESTLLAGVGGAAGCILAVWGIRLVALMDLPVNASAASLDYRVLGFTLLLSLFTGVAFGLAPALGVTGVTLTPALRADGDAPPQGRRRLTLRNVLVVSQVALSCVLLVWGGVFLQRLAAGQAADLGFNTDGLAFVQTDAGFAGYEADEAAALYGRLRDRIAALPGVESTTLTATPPPEWSGSTRSLVVDGGAPADQEDTAVLWSWAGPGYFSTLQVPLLYGRTFTELDRADRPLVAVINESLARRYFGTSNAVGRRFRLAGAPGATGDTSPAEAFEVIGVVPNTRTSVFDEGLRPLFYRSVVQAPATTATVIIRTSLEPAGLLPSMQRAVRELDPELPVVKAATMTRHITDSLGVERAAAASLGGLGALGLGLASLGLYAVVAFAVSRRTREIGIRMALGARRTQVLGTVLRSAATLVGVGVVTGLALSWLSVRAAAWTASSLSQSGGVGLATPTADPFTFVLVAVLMAVVGVTATVLPALHAAKVDPLVALRRV